MAGRKPLPTNVKILKGTARKHRLNPDEPQPEIEIPDPPEILKGDALKEWRRITVELEKMGLMSKADRTALAAYCQCYARWVEAEKTIQESSLLIKTNNGNVAPNPAIKIANTALTHMLKYLTEFGLTPSSRTRVAAKPKKKENSGWGNFKKNG